ncbi:MAG TPA: class I SAM-dependent methyltransferase [Gemmatimonadaceae bacterium]|nr:class I SAM-dependent methyltransferase [Gemmatimonadaceae bacterium]
MSASRAPGDHFSGVAASYAAFRPRYPRALFEFLASVAPTRARAWDCGAGTGQATLGLAEFFDEVIATDVSVEQIAHAPRHAGVRWCVAPAESVPIASASVDLVTVAQALHWFDHARFYAEVRRVCVPNAVIAAWTYLAPRTDGEVGRVLRRFMRDDLRGYWPAERKYVDDEYRSIPFPFERIPTPEFRIEYDWTLSQVDGYLRSMSPVARYERAHERNPVDVVLPELASLWGEANVPRRFEWPVVLLAGRVARESSEFVASR